MTKDSSRSTYKIYIGNLSPSVSNEDLYTLFGQFGLVVEAIVLHGKGYGFVHMGNENEGVLAMKSLYKFTLHGKELLIQPAINPKAASISGKNGNSSHKATIGKGVSTLDDFEESPEYDTKYLEQELHYMLDNSSPPELNTGLPISNGSTTSLSRNSSQTSIRSPPQQNSIISLQNNGGNNVLNQMNGGSVALNTNGFGHVQPVLPVNYQSLNVNNSNPVPLAAGINSWSSAGSNYNPELPPKNTSILGSNQSNNIRNGAPIHPLINTSVPLAGNKNFASPGFLNEISQINVAQQQAQLYSQLQQYLAQSTGNSMILNNPQLVTSLANSFTDNASNGLVANDVGSLQVKQLREKLFGSNSQRLQSLENRGLDKERFHTDHAKNSIMDNLRNLTGSSTSTSIAGSSQSNGTGDYLRDINSGSPMPTSEIPSSCLMCNELYDTNNRTPKILGCTHTFCQSCLCRMTVAGNRVKCPIGCEVLTRLSEAGVAGLTTNQGLLSRLSQDNNDNFLQHSLNLLESLSLLSQNNFGSSSDQPEVCAICSGSARQQPISKCKEEGHTLVPTTEAVKLISSQLRPTIENAVTMLEQTITHNNAKKERHESAMRAIHKFSTELNSKIAKEVKANTVCSSMLNSFSGVKNNLERRSYNDLVRIYHMVMAWIKDIEFYFNSAVRDTAVNEAVKAVVVQVHQKSMQKVLKYGIHPNELFVMDNGDISDNTRVGNYANALLQYMVNDLLMSRINHNLTLDKETLNNSDKSLAAINEDKACESTDNLSSRSATSSVSPDNLNSDNAASSMYRSLQTSTSATPDNLNASEIGSVDTTNDVSCVIQTTEAIEAEHLKTKSFNYMDEVSLGLTNICHRVMNEETSPIDAGNNSDLDRSLLEGTPLEGNIISLHNASNHSPILSDILASSQNNMDNSELTTKSKINKQSSGSTCEDSDLYDNEIKPFSYVDAAKKPAKPQSDTPVKQEVVKVPVIVKQAKNPHAWLKLTVDGEPIGRIVFQLRPDKAPRMCENFLGLCTGKPGYGYKGTHFFKNGEGFLAGGDVEYDDGRGGYSIFNRDKFEADLCPLKDEVGMIRFKGNGTSDSGKGMVGSQFMVWYAEREFKKFSYSLVFGRVVDGMDIVKKAANVDLGIHDVMIEDCGGGF